MMAPGRRLAALASFASLGLLSACSVPDAGDPVAESQAPIVGGVLDDFRSYVVGVGDGMSNFCTGTLISRRTVLTAGHCYTPGMGATGGITRIYFGPSIAGMASFVSVAQAVRHPGFDTNTLANDLTLVQLSADPPAPWQAVPLLRETMTNTPAFVGPYFTFAGYGNDGMMNYDVRRVVIFPIVAVGPAANVGLDTGTGPIGDSQFYYRTAGKNTCDGDSGGPAFVPRNHVERLAGSTSYGDSPCLVDGVDARTDAPVIAAFIQPTLDLFEPMDPCRADGMCNESCNVNNMLVDPDCAPNHCGMDGMCVISCVDPPDPDCVLPAGVNHCGPDGVCDPSCAPTDPDCLPPPDAGAPGTGGAGGAGTTASAGGSSASSTSHASSSHASASSGGHLPDAGAPDGGAGGHAGGHPVAKMKSGCGCSVPGSSGGGERLALGLALGALALARRRRG